MFDGLEFEVLLMSFPELLWEESVVVALRLLLLTESVAVALMLDSELNVPDPETEVVAVTVAV